MKIARGPCEVKSSTKLWISRVVIAAYSCYIHFAKHQAERRFVSFALSAVDVQEHGQVHPNICLGFLIQ